jgi:hypothetical protein
MSLLGERSAGRTPCLKTPTVTAMNECDVPLGVPGRCGKLKPRQAELRIRDLFRVGDFMSYEDFNGQDRSAVPKQRDIRLHATGQDVFDRDLVVVRKAVLDLHPSRAGVWSACILNAAALHLQLKRSYAAQLEQLVEVELPYQVLDALAGGPAINRSRATVIGPMTEMVTVDGAFGLVDGLLALCTQVRALRHSLASRANGDYASMRVDCELDPLSFHRVPKPYTDTSASVRHLHSGHRPP